MLKFQSTLPRGSDSSAARGSLRAADFNPRSLAGATFREAFQIQRWYDFNPRSLAGATMVSVGDFSSELFQSTLPRGSDIINGYIVNRNIKFQSTLPRGSDLYADIKRQHMSISIHAPSRERPLLRFMPLMTSTFQSTLPRGSDCYQRYFDS